MNLAWRRQILAEKGTARGDRVELEPDQVLLVHTISAHPPTVKNGDYLSFDESLGSGICRVCPSAGASGTRVTSALLLSATFGKGGSKALRRSQDLLG